MSDLTRWNRAGLSKLAYIDGNAATYQEDLRLSLRTLFQDDAKVLQWLGDEANDNTIREWQQRLLEQYQQDRRDYAWEILRSFGRTVHILAHTVDAYANERYIRTATQWDNVRRLVNMLDYHPAPPASAETYVALLANSDDQAIGTLAAGFAIKNEPTDGSAPLIFESLADIDIDYRLNELKAPDHNRSPDRVWFSGTSFNFDPDVMPDEISVGDYAILTDKLQAIAVSVQAIYASSVVVTSIDSEFSGSYLNVADLTLEMVSDWRTAPKLNGPNVVQVDQIDTVTVNDVLAFWHGSAYYARRVLAIEGDRVEFDKLNSISATESFYLTSASKPQVTGFGNFFVYPKVRKSSKVWIDNTNLSEQFPQVQRVDPDNPSSAVLNHRLDGSLASNSFFLPDGAKKVFAVKSISPSQLEFPGSPEGISSGQRILLKTASGDWYCRTIATITELEDSYQLGITPSLPAGKSWSQVVGNFKTVTKTANHNMNYDNIYTVASDSTSDIEVALDSIPEALIYGRTLWIVNNQHAQRVTLLNVEHNAGQTIATLSVTPSLAGMHLSKSSTAVYANVVRFGHGESKSENVLGDGNRVMSEQCFVYQKKDIAFVQDNEFSSGVKADIIVWADQREWTQVENLRDSEQTDTHYQVKLTQDGFIQVAFGDGIHGQRLPTGSNNVRIQARFGNGLKGNLGAHALTKIKQPNPLVDTVIQPAPCTGGGDLEAAESIRTNAPASVLTLSRAVSIRDFQALAKRQSTVWHANAYALPPKPGAADSLAVVIVPAGGGQLGELQQNLTTTLMNKAQPGVNVVVKPYQPVILSLDISIRVDAEAYNLDEVTVQVRLALQEVLSLQNAAFGKTLYRSRLYQIIEAVEGVENADCVINKTFVDEHGVQITDVKTYIGSDDYIRNITPNREQIIYLNTHIAPLTIRTEVFNG